MLKLLSIGPKREVTRLALKLLFFQYSLGVCFGICCMYAFTFVGDVHAILCLLAFEGELVDLVTSEVFFWLVVFVAFVDGEVRAQAAIGVEFERPATCGHVVVFIWATHRLEA